MRSAIVGCLLAAACAAPAHEHGHHHDGPLVRRFDDADKAVRMFERAGRDEYQKPEAVVSALGLGPESVVADVGAGSGYFARRLAKVAGRVYAVDIEPVLVEHLAREGRRLDLPNLVPVLGDLDDPRLPEPVDLALIVNTWHHIPSRTAYVKRLAERLKEGGRVVIIDYRAGDLPVGPPDPHKVPEAVVEQEMAAAGMRLHRRHDLLPYQYFLEFTR